MSLSRRIVNIMTVIGSKSRLSNDLARLGAALRACRLYSGGWAWEEAARLGARASKAGRRYPPKRDSRAVRGLTLSENPRIR